MFSNNQNSESKKEKRENLLEKIKYSGWRCCLGGCPLNLQDEK